MSDNRLAPRFGRKAPTHGHTPYVFCGSKRGLKSFDEFLRRKFGEQRSGDPGN
jgi:hypothetical protein